MNLRPALLACLLSIVPTLAGADVFVIPLAGAPGTYGVGAAPLVSQRTLSFQLPGSPSLIHGASLHVKGTAQVGSYVCFSGGPYPWPVILTGQMNDPPNNDWSATQQLSTPGAFDVTVPFTTFAYLNVPAGTWGFLGDGVGEVTLGAGPAPFFDDCAGNLPWPTVTVEQASILLDADIPVAAHGASWCSVKAIYR